MLTFCKVWLWKIQPVQRETLTTFRWLLLVLLPHSNTLWSPIQGDILGPQGCLGSTSEGQLVQVQSSPVLLFPPDRPQDPGSTEDHQVAGWSEDTHSVQELSLRNGRLSGWVGANGTERGRNSASVGGKGREENGEVGMQRTCTGAGWRKWDHCEGTWVRLALQDHMKSVQRKQKAHPPHSLLVALRIPFPRAGMQI